MRLAPGWQRFVLPPLGLAGLAGLGALRWPALGWVGLAALVLALLLAAFFRDPDREIASGIVAAADGRVRSVRPEAIVTFLNVHHVHVVRAPYAGEVTRVTRFDGSHAPAFLDRSDRNAGIALAIDTAWGVHDVHLIAGLVARQAVAFVEAGDRVERGERIGMIRFGSRVDVDLPPGSEPVVEEGARVQAGATTIAHAPSADGEEGAA